MALSIVVGLAIACAVIERALEIHDASRLTANETFVTIRDKKVRYRKTGAGRPGPTVVLVSGMMALLEQWDAVQTELGESPVISYDRGGMGFSDPSDAHDATAEAEELDALLRATGVPPPYVLVTYSGSAYLARVYAAKHADLVKGFVFIDPWAKRVVDPQGRTLLRAQGHMLFTMSWQSLLGYQRLKMVGGQYVHQRSPMSPVVERDKYARVSFHQWFATLQEVEAFERSREEANATPAIEDLPLGVLSSMQPEDGAEQRDLLAAHREFAAESKRGLLRRLMGVSHSVLLETAEGNAAAVALIREITASARELGVGRSP
jgi:pimeloyl-ACP methyl ester carboxylesterase